MIRTTLIGGAIAAVVGSSAALLWRYAPDLIALVALGIGLALVVAFDPRNRWPG